MFQRKAFGISKAVSVPLPAAWRRQKADRGAVSACRPVLGFKSSVLEQEHCFNPPACICSKCNKNRRKTFETLSLGLLTGPDFDQISCDL